MSELNRRTHELISVLVLNQCLLITLTGRQIELPTWCHIFPLGQVTSLDLGFLHR